MVRSALADTRRWVRALNPISLQRGITPDTLRAFVATLAGTGVELDVQVNGEVPILDEGTQLILYSTLQKGVTNAIRHAGANRIDVDLHYGENLTRLTIRNDGAVSDARPGGFGLAPLRRRVTEQEGSLAFALRGGRPFEATLTVEVPVTDRGVS